MVLRVGGLRAWALALTVMGWLGGWASAARAEPVLVLAAASLKGALEALAPEIEARTGGGLALSFAASSALARQIENDAPADLFISADLEWMDYLEKRSLIRPETRVNLLGNNLVLIAPRVFAGAVDLTVAADWAKALGDGRLAVGDPAHVPAGRYARAALQSLDLWTALEPRLARVDNVRVALALVSRGEAPLGIVYGTDALADKGVRVVATFPAASHPAVIYPMAQVAGSRHPRAAAVLAALRTPDAAAVFRSQGFVPLLGP